MLSFKWAPAIAAGCKDVLSAEQTFLASLSEKAGFPFLLVSVNGNTSHYLKAALLCDMTSSVMHAYVHVLIDSDRTVCFCCEFCIILSTHNIESKQKSRFVK